MLFNAARLLLKLSSSDMLLEWVELLADVVVVVLLLVLLVSSLLVYLEKMCLLSLRNWLHSKSSSLNNDPDLAASSKKFDGLSVLLLCELVFVAAEAMSVEGKRNCE